jgi:hypothetical protein
MSSTVKNPEYDANLLASAPRATKEQLQVCLKCPTQFPVLMILNLAVWVYNGFIETKDEAAQSQRS